MGGVQWRGKTCLRITLDCWNLKCHLELPPKRPPLLEAVIVASWRQHRVSWLLLALVPWYSSALLDQGNISGLVPLRVCLAWMKSQHTKNAPVSIRILGAQGSMKRVAMA